MASTRTHLPQAEAPVAIFALYTQAETVADAVAALRAIIAEANDATLGTMLDLVHEPDEPTDYPDFPGLMLALLTGPADGPQADIASRIPARSALWIATDLEPADDTRKEVLHRLPWAALIALSERLAFPTGTMLSISTLDGFGTAPQRTVVKGDHTDQTAALSRQAHAGTFPHDLIVLATLSGLYEDGSGRMAFSARSGSDRALETARMITSNAIAHLCWNFRASGVPTVALCWDVERTLKGKVTGESVNAPRRIVAMADVAMRIEQGQPVVTSARERSGFTVGEAVADWTAFLKG